jgi:hypothetical protein
MKIGTHIKVDNIFYNKTSKGDIVITAHSKHHVDHCNKESSSLIHAFGVTFPRKSMYDLKEIPELSNDLPEIILKNRGIFGHPFTTINREHLNYGSRCNCAPTVCDFHAKVFIESVCFLTAFTEPNDNKIDFQFSLDQLLPNSSRVYLYSAVSRRPVLQLPTPYLLSYRWKPKIYLATNSLEPMSPRLHLFYALHSAKAYREGLEPYLAEPDTWEESQHPCFMEPSPSDELHLWSKNLYGIETLPRVLVTQHPGRSSEINVYSAMKQDFAVPVIANPTNQFSAEDFIKIVLKPFYAQGAGRAICAICVLTISNKRFQPACFTRSKFVQHFRHLHHRNLPVIGLAFSTTYHSRMLEAFTLYTYCQAHMDDEAQDFEASAPMTSEADLSRFNVTYSYHIQDLLIRSGQEDLTTKRRFGFSESSEAGAHQTPEATSTPRNGSRMETSTSDSILDRSDSEDSNSEKKMTEDT